MQFTITIPDDVVAQLQNGCGDISRKIVRMNVTEYLKQQGKATKQVFFDGEPFTAQSVWRIRDRVLR